MASIPLEPRVLANQRLHWNRLETLWQILPHALVILIFSVGAFFAHELGHALVAQFFGARVVMFNVLGMQWYPKLEWMPQFGFGGYVYWFAPVNLTNHRLIMLSGSTTMLLVSIAAVSALSLLPLRAWTRTACIVMSLYFLDGLFKILPVLGWMPLGWNSRFTRSFSEAYFAAVGLGISREMYIAAIFVSSALILILLARALTRSRTTARL